MDKIAIEQTKLIGLQNTINKEQERRIEQLTKENKEHLIYFERMKQQIKSLGEKVNTVSTDYLNTIALKDKEIAELRAEILDT